MSAYLRAARFDRRVTGNVLHLRVLDKRDGREVALCGQRIAGRWLFTSTGARGWVRHAHWPLCTRCAAEHDRLAQDVIEQEERVIEHADMPMRTAHVEPADDTPDPEQQAAAVRHYFGGAGAEPAPVFGPRSFLSGPPGADVPQYDTTAVPAYPEP